MKLASRSFNDKNWSRCGDNMKTSAENCDAKVRSGFSWLQIGPNAGIFCVSFLRLL
jgi:hypothetical protein